MDYNFTFKNFIPCTATQRYCAGKFHQIWIESPSDSNVMARVKKNAEGIYLTKIEIKASQGQFESQSEGRYAVDSVKNAFEQMKMHLSLWKSDHEAAAVK
jgi:hypothetical protein